MAPADHEYGSGSGSGSGSATENAPTCFPSPPHPRYQIPGSLPGKVERGKPLDLDGDGVAERWATDLAYCNAHGNCRYTLADGATCRELGVIGGPPLRTLTPKRGKWPDIETEEYVLGNPLQVRYRFDGHRYVGLAMRECLTTEYSDCMECDPWETITGEYPEGGWKEVARFRGYATRCTDPRPDRRPVNR
ncbi:MAG: hypothetical protein KIT31_10775 [Deltaproteobacteria bacterium]|nr:hypothetical protein [Deltaproteobacteria bacterium]